MATCDLNQWQVQTPQGLPNCCRAIHPHPDIAGIRRSMHEMWRDGQLDTLRGMPIPSKATHMAVTTQLHQGQHVDCGQQGRNIESQQGTPYQSQQPSARRHSGRSSCRGTRGQRTFRSWRYYSQVCSRCAHRKRKGQRKSPVDKHQICCRGKNSRPK